jgi:hypothetical protein
VSRRSGSFQRLVLYVTIVPRDGLPFLRHVVTVTLTGIDKNIISRLPIILASARPIKGQVRALQKGGRKTTNNEPDVR